MSRGRARATVAMLGPAFVASIAYVDPGNFSTNISAGSGFGYRLVWVVVLANVMAMPIQYLSAKVGIVTGKSLPEVCRDLLPVPVRWLLWVQAELVAMATDMAELVGAALGLNLLCGVPMLPAALITGVAAFGVLGMQVRGYRSFERAVAALLLIITGGFGYELLRVGPAVAPATSGLVPALPTGSLYLTVGIIGATVMPHVVYLHSSLTGHRVACSTVAGQRAVLRFERLDVIIALGVAGLVNVVMLLVAAKLLHGSSHGDPGSVQVAHAALSTRFGGAAALVFVVALLASGVSSASVGTFAGQVVMAGFIGIRISLPLRRLITMVPALVVIGLGINATTVLNFSQVVLSFGIPFAVILLLLAVRDRGLLGEFASPRWVMIVMTAIVTVIIGLNLALLYGQLTA